MINRHSVPVGKRVDTAEGEEKKKHERTNYNNKLIPRFNMRGTVTVETMKNPVHIIILGQEGVGKSGKNIFLSFFLSFFFFFFYLCVVFKLTNIHF